MNSGKCRAVGDLCWGRVGTRTAVGDEDGEAVVGEGARWGAGGEEGVMLGMNNEWVHRNENGDVGDIREGCKEEVGETMVT